MAGGTQAGRCTETGAGIANPVVSNLRAGAMAGWQTVQSWQSLACPGACPGAFAGAGAGLPGSAWHMTNPPSMPGTPPVARAGGTGPRVSATSISHATIRRAMPDRAARTGCVRAITT